MSIAVGVALDKLNIVADKLFDYMVPQGFESYAKAGVRVTVPFGRGNTPRNGVIFSVCNQNCDRQLKEVSEFLDEKPILSDEFLGLAKFMSERYFCTLFDGVKTILPAATRLKLKELICVSQQKGNLNGQQKSIIDYLNKHKTCEANSLYNTFDSVIIDEMLESGILTKEYEAFQKVNDAYVKSARLIMSADEVKQYLESACRNKTKHEKVIDILSGCDTVPVTELCYLAGVTVSVINTLEKYGVIEVFDIEVFRNPYKDKPKSTEIEEIELTRKQQEAYEGLLKLYSEDNAKAALLYGITGSGKTLVYLKLIDRAIAQNKNVILIVPEISLTPQITERMFARYGDVVAVLHSGMSVGERFDEWKRVKSGKAKIVIGTRSAIFAPFDEVSLIIIDEEQESTYKSENTPRYNAKDVAKYRAAYHKALLLLTSATPSIESYAAAKSDKIKLFEIDQRYGNSILPNVHICDMTKELRNGNGGNFSQQLKDEIEKNLQKGEQTILFHNRRGFNTFISCRDCGYVFTCPNCSISMTFHNANKLLMCHYCGHNEQVASRCPSCGSSSVRYMGTGTQRIDEEIKALFPTARTVRMDLDTTSYKMSHENILTDFANHKYDILIGTQMVTKGLDLPNVTLVGVLLADLMLYSEDFRCAEKAFSMLTQVVGRAGRADKEGRAIIQTYNPLNHTVELAAKQDYKSFYKDEISFRRIMAYPPFCDIYQFLVTGESENEVKNAAISFCGKLSESFAMENTKNIVLYPPLPSALLKVGGKYRYRIIMKCKNEIKLRQNIRKLLIDFYRENKSVILTVDTNPQMII